MIPNLSYSSNASTAGARSSAKPIRIARVVARLNVGGPAIHVAQLTARLPPEDFETRLYAGQVSADEREMSEILQRERVEPVRIPRLGRAVRPWDDALTLTRLVNEFRRFRPDIVHTHTAKAGTLGRIAARLVGAAVVVHTFHGHVFEGYFGPTTSRAIIEIERTLSRITDAVITISPNQHEDITRKFRITAPDKARIIPLGIDLSRFRDIGSRRGELRSELCIPANLPIVSTIGRLTAVKDHPLLLRAMAALDRPVALLVVGGGEELEALRALARTLWIGDRVHFLGFRTDLERILADSDVVALTSQNEGTPVALIEALAAGCAVVATDVGGVADVLGGGAYGRLVPTRDPSRFAKALSEVLEETLVRAGEQRTEAARAHVFRHFDVSRLVSDHAELYRQLLGRL
jgi:glycosyltransferase involved in cell wall biosynthesis